MNKITIASIATLLATSGIAFAHGGEGHGLARFDRDGNGVVSRDEMRAAASEHFDKVDANKDGRITADEMQAAGRDRASKHFAKKDKNGDGKLTRDEVAHMPDQVFARIDANHDGALAPDELAAAHQGHGDRGAKFFEHLDTNHDGVVSKDEALAGADQRFSKMDANGDGVVTKDEVKARFGHHGGKDGGQNQTPPSQ